jgi:beta-mannanase
MQVPASSASLASILAQSTSKDKASGAGAIAADAVPTSAANVEKSGSSSADRDAQGQGDGFDERPTSKDEEDILDIACVEKSQLPMADLPDEPPSQLDIIG